MATITLVANTDYSSLAVADGDTIDLAGYELTFDINPPQEDVIVHSPGTGGTVVLGSPTVFDLVGWTFTAGTGPLIQTIPDGTVFGGSLIGGEEASAYGCVANTGIVLGDVTGGVGPTAYGINVSTGHVSGRVTGGSGNASRGLHTNYGTVVGRVSGGPGTFAYGMNTHSGAPLLGGILDTESVAISVHRGITCTVNGPECRGNISSRVKTIYSLFGPLHPSAGVAPGTEVIVLSGDVSEAMLRGNLLAQRGVNL